MFIFVNTYFCQDVNNMTINDSANDNAKESFTFVVISAGNDDPLQEVRKPKTAERENDEVKKYAKAYFGYSQDKRLERTELDYPRPANNHTFVTMYSYSNAKAEDMPVNKRASALASACMTFNTLVYGDAILARYLDKFHAEKAVSKW